MHKMTCDSKIYLYNNKQCIYQKIKQYQYLKINFNYTTDAGDGTLTNKSARDLQTYPHLTLHDTMVVGHSDITANKAGFYHCHFLQRFL